MHCRRYGPRYDVHRSTKCCKKFRWYIDIYNSWSRLVSRLCTFSKPTLKKGGSTLLSWKCIELGVVEWSFEICLGFIFVVRYVK